MKIKLSPFVFKIKGKRNYLLFDSLKKNIYCIIPEGCPYELENQLIKMKLAIKTDGVIPFKYKPDIKKYDERFVLRELQLRITGECNYNCKYCNEVGFCKKNNLDISKTILDKIINQLIGFEIENITFIGGNPLLKEDIIDYIKSKINSYHYRILLPIKKISDKNFTKILNKHKLTHVYSICNLGKISENTMMAEIDNFFYNQIFNPCWGNKIAIDVNGDIKPCIWADSIGNVEIHNVIKSLIISNKIDSYWKLSKDNFETCKECEYRYNCFDCRVKAIKENDSSTSKTVGCNYNPINGNWV
jgi:radical SAM protein with 4Fe4S-binding SPASM domain